MIEVIKKNTAQTIDGTGFVKAAGTTITYDNTTYEPELNGSGFLFQSGLSTSYINGIPQTLYIKNSITQLINTTVSTNVLTGLSGGGTALFAANSFEINTLYEVEVMGDTFNNSLGAANFTANFDFNGTVNLSAGLINNQNLAGNRFPFVIRAQFYFTSIGVSGVCVFTSFSFYAIGNTGSMLCRNTQPASTFVVNTTVAQTLRLMAANSAANLNIIFTAASAYIRKTKM